MGGVNNGSLFEEKILNNVGMKVGGGEMGLNNGLGLNNNN
jgi:hypothetical protein